MITYRKPNRVRDMVGAILFAVAAALLWVESSVAENPSDSVAVEQMGQMEQAVIRAATHGDAGNG